MIVVSSANFGGLTSGSREVVVSEGVTSGNYTLVVCLLRMVALRVDKVMDLKNDGMMILHPVLKSKKQGVYKCYEGVKVFKDVEESHATCAIHKPVSLAHGCIFVTGGTSHSSWDLWSVVQHSLLSLKTWRYRSTCCHLDEIKCFHLRPTLIILILLNSTQTRQHENWSDPKDEIRCIL